MDELYSMKGHSQPLVTILSGRQEIYLVAFCDGSLGVGRNQQVVGL